MESQCVDLECQSGDIWLKEGKIILYIIGQILYLICETSNCYVSNILIGWGYILILKKLSLSSLSAIFYNGSMRGYPI